MKYETLQQSLSEQIQILYITCLEHKPAEVVCKLSEEMLVITVDDPVTKIEHVLVKSGKQELAEEVRDNIHKAFQPQLRTLIEQVLGISVVDLIGNSNLYTGRTVVTAILAHEPDTNI